MKPTRVKNNTHIFCNYVTLIITIAINAMLNVIFKGMVEIQNVKINVAQSNIGAVNGC